MYQCMQLRLKRNEGWRGQGLGIIPNYVAPSSWWEHGYGTSNYRNSQAKICCRTWNTLRVSFFSFCEAAEKFSEQTYIYTVDTWSGDEHAGYYSDEVYNKVRAHLSKYHSQRAEMMRCKFEDAVKI